MKTLSGLSFCVITDGRRQKTITTGLQSIGLTCTTAKIDYEVNLVGVVEELNLPKDIDIKRVHVTDPFIRERLGALRNLAASRARFETLIFADDDIVFSSTWARRLSQFSEFDDWKVLGNRILLPDGGRYWDRATLSPHRLVDYDHPATDPNLYQSGGFVVIDRLVSQQFPWNSNITFYGERQGGENEDVEFSRRLTQAGYMLSFDRHNTVWHFDTSYQQSGDCILREQANNQQFCEEFRSLLACLARADRPGHGRSSRPPNDNRQWRIAR